MDKLIITDFHSHFSGLFFVYSEPVELWITLCITENFSVNSLTT